MYGINFVLKKQQEQTNATITHLQSFKLMTIKQQRDKQYNVTVTRPIFTSNNTIIVFKLKNRQKGCVTQKKFHSTILIN